MKKILFIALALLTTNVMFAKEKCCKGKGKCNKEASAKCDKKEEGKACCKKGNHGEAATTTAPAEMHACCKKAVAEGKPACCAKKAETPADKK